MPLTFLYQSVIPYALLVFLLMKLFYYVFMVFIDKWFWTCFIFMYENNKKYQKNCFISNCFNFNLKSALLIFSFTYFHQWKYK